jgi:hypothetical protein
MNGNLYAKNALIVPLLKNVTIVIKYAEANFLPVGRVIKPTFAKIVLRCILMMIGRNYALCVAKQKRRTTKRESVLIGKSLKRGRQNIGVIGLIFSAIHLALCKRSM